MHHKPEPPIRRWALPLLVVLLAAAAATVAIVTAFSLFDDPGEFEEVWEKSHPVINGGSPR